MNTAYGLHRRSDNSLVQLDEYLNQQFDAPGIANTGDATVVNGKVWPIDNTSAAVGDSGLTDIRYLKDLGTNALYALAVDNTFHLVSGSITALDFANKTATVGGTSYSLYTLSQEKDITAKELNLEHWGIVADGSTDNSDSLLKVRSIMLNEPSVIWKVNGVGGTVAYTNNKWLLDVKNMEFDGKGCELLNLNNSAVTSQESRPLFIQRLFEGNVENNIFDVHQGFVIQDVDAGSGSVFTNTAADAGRISKGEWALVYGYDQQSFGGYLPNARFFDWMLVDTVNPTTGEIVFRGGNRLRNSYSNLWADGTAGGVNIGRPRIISTVRTTAQGYNANRTMPINRVWKDVKFSNTNPLGQSWGDSAVFLKMEQFTVRNQGTFFGALGSKECIYDNIRFDQPNQKPLTEFGMETDKLTERCIVNNTSFGHGIAGGTGVDNLVYNFCSFPKDSRIRIGAKNQTFNECEFLGCRSVSQAEYVLQASDNFSESTTFNSCRFKLNDDQEGIFRRPSGSKTIPSADWTALGNRQISLTGDSSVNNYASQLSIGSLVVIGDSLTDGNGQVGVVEGIRASGANVIVALRGTQQTNFDDSQDITMYTFNPPEYNNCLVYKSDGSSVNQPLSAATPAFLYNKNPYKTLKWSSLQNKDSILGRIDYPCYVREVRVNVAKEYTGTDADFHIEIARREQGSQRLQVAATATGFRRFNSGEQTNPQTGDTFVANFFDTPNLQGLNVFIRTTTGGGQLPADIGSANVAPIYTVEVDLEPITT